MQRHDRADELHGHLSVEEKKTGRFREWRNRVSDRLARSSRVFLFGVIVACGVEVIGDWSTTLTEINLLRANVRHKGENYVGILGKPSLAALRARDATELARLTEGLDADDEVAFIRFYDAHGKRIYEHVRSDFAPTFAPHRALYDHLSDRDVAGMLADPAAYKVRVGGSRHRDFAQTWTDATAHAKALIAKPNAPATRLERVLFQDRLRDEDRNRDDKMTWAIGVLGEDNAVDGAVLVAFDMRETTAAIHTKYLKGLGVVAFFVALIIVQNVIARRDKLRLLDLQTRYAGAKGALRAALPEKPLDARGFRVVGTLDQAKGPVDGMAWFAAESGERIVAMIVDPDGDGIDAAAVGLHMIKVFRARCEAGIDSLDAEVIALGAATSDIPLTRPIGIAIVSIDPKTNAFEARTTAFATLRVLRGTTPPQTNVPIVPDGIVGPLARSTGTLDPGATLLVFCAGIGEKQATLESDALVRYLERAHAPGTPLPIEDAATWARGRNPTLAENDIALLGITRS